MRQERRDSNSGSKLKLSRPEPGGDRYQVIFEKLPHPAWVLDLATLRFLAANEAAISKYRYSLDEFRNMSYLDIHLPEDAPIVKERLTNGQSASPGTCVWRHKTKWGVLLDVVAAWSPIPFDGVRAILLTAGSAHEGPEQETGNDRERLGALSRRLVELQETERAEIARELHDEIGQLLTGLKLMLSAEGPEPRSGGGLTDPGGSRRDQMLQVVNELMGLTRSISMDLRPPMLDQLGLLPALAWHFERFTEQTRVRVSFSHTGIDTRFPRASETASFRIIQEALTNAARHAGIETLEVEVRADSASLMLRVADRGSGFDMEAASAACSAGLTGMQERALLVGGHLRIESFPGAGTRVTAELPLRKRSESGG
jgi:signal transduction histidine kinase